MCKGPEAENWWSEESNVLKDLHVCGLLSKEEKDLSYGWKGKSWGRGPKESDFKDNGNDIRML